MLESLNRGSTRRTWRTIQDRPSLEPSHAETRRPRRIGPRSKSDGRQCNGGTVERWNGQRGVHECSHGRICVCGAARLSARHEYLLVAARHAGVMLYDGSLKHVSISPLVASYYIKSTERGSATARHSTGVCADDRAAWPGERVVSPMLQAVASNRRDRDARRSCRAASDQHRASRATHHRGHGNGHPDHTDEAAANTRSHPAARAPIG